MLSWHRFRRTARWAAKRARRKYPYNEIAVEEAPRDSNKGSWQVVRYLPG